MIPSSQWRDSCNQVVATTHNTASTNNDGRRYRDGWRHAEMMIELTDTTGITSNQDNHVFKAPMYRTLTGSITTRGHYFNGIPARLITNSITKIIPNCDAPQILFVKTVTATATVRYLCFTYKNLRHCNNQHLQHCYNKSLRNCRSRK